MARYVDYDGTLPPSPQATPEQELLKSLTKLVKLSPPHRHCSKHELHGLYSGPTSIAYLFFRCSPLFGSDPEIAGRKTRQWCDAYLSHEVPSEPVEPDRCGVASETLSHLTLLILTNTDPTAHIQNFLAYVPAILSPSPHRPASNEWLYGRAGTLYLLRLIRCSVAPDPEYSPRIDAAIAAISAKIIAEGPDWRWHGKEYLGAVHGSIGILAQVMRSLSMIGRPPPRVCWGWLRDILNSQFESGNWPSSLGRSAARDELVQFCHGAPGFVISLLAIRKVIEAMEDDARLNNDAGAEMTAKIDDQLGTNVRELSRDIEIAISKARECIKQRGVLTKEPCLCHGATGNALALEGEERKVMMNWTQEEIVKKGTDQGWYVKGDDPVGLFCGEAGRASGWIVMLQVGGNDWVQ